MLMVVEVEDIQLIRQMLHDLKLHASDALIKEFINHSNDVRLGLARNRLDKGSFYCDLIRFLNIKNPESCTDLLICWPRHWDSPAYKAGFCVEFIKHALNKGFTFLIENWTEDFCNTRNKC